MSSSVGIVGCTGAVGQEMISVLHKRNFPLSELHLFASARSAGKVFQTPFGEKTVEEFSVEKTKNLDFVLMAVSGSFAKEYAREIAKGKPIVIDNSSAFRLENDVPLICPEVNPKAAQGHKLIANPNCSTLILNVALYPLHREFTCKKVIVSTYQATSGAGAPAMEELRTETQHFLNGEPVLNKEFVHPIPFNLIPHIDSFQENGYTREEMKVTWETRKIFGAPNLPISCTAVRIPTFRAHAESVTIETEKPISPEMAREILKMSPGVEVRDAPEEFLYPMPLTASQKENVEVGRIRQSLIFGENGIDFFLCGDQLLKGAALNAVQISELFV
ncbi:aspartate-semialdehyde dehydrogenase [Candidatus Peregrinibacteria bacterium]|nr:MAG: aspartate-semialdehyde dehydrogenase [Candidatus Peregrinibacteria bacterium]